MHHGYQVDPRHMHHGYQVDPRHMHHGYQVDPRHMHHGYQVDPRHREREKLFDALQIIQHLNRCASSLLAYEALYINI